MSRNCLLCDRLRTPLAYLGAPLALFLVLVHVLWGSLFIFFFPLLGERVQSALMQFWSRVLLLILGLRVELHPRPDSMPLAQVRGALVLSNHVSWVDVFVIVALVPVRFVAKAEVARWPVLGRAAAGAGTVYVERGRRHAVAHVNHVVVERLRGGQTVGVFPEGTTTDGFGLLRFHANLVQPAIDAPAPLIPVGLQYRQDGQATRVSAFIGDMTLARSLWRILLAPGLSVRLHWLEPIQPDAEETRQSLSQRARTAIAEALEIDVD